MRACFSTYGSRGDVQPLVALAVQLQALGAEVRVCAPPDQEFAQLMARVGVTLVPAFSPVREWVTERLNRKVMDLPRAAAEVMTAQFDAITAAAEGSDVLLASGVFSSTAAARSVAERLGIPYVYAAYCPFFLPSPYHRPLEYPGRPHPTEVTDNRVLWELDVQTMNALLGDAFRVQRASIGLATVNNIRDHVFTDHPWLAADAALAPWRRPTPLDVVQTGAWILPDERPLPAELIAFLDAGAPPVYVGFGSMPQHTLKEIGHTIIEVIRAQGRRALVYRGWADLALFDDRADCFAIEEVNQQALLRRVAAVIHHGGAGTTTAATRAGAPQVVIPQIGDQPYWAGRVADLGIGAAHVGPIPTTESVSAALQVALAPETRARVGALAAMIRTDGATVAAKLLLESLAAA
jgi:vancomycin aglycone glucosyltransferase